MQPPPSTSSKTRRSFLEFAGFASLGLIPDILYWVVFAYQSSVPNSSKSTSPVNNLSKFSFEVVTVNAKGEISDRHNQKAQFFSENINGVTLEMVSIPGGTFIMGAPDTEKERGSNEGPQHQVKVASFFMGKYPVTQAQMCSIIFSIR